MKNAGDGRVRTVFVKVFGFGDAERHALNTLFRLSQYGPIAYMLWSDEAPVKAEALLMDGESWEAGVELARPSFEPLPLIWVGNYAPQQAIAVFQRPLRWPEVIDAMDQLFGPSTPVSSSPLLQPGFEGEGRADLDFDLDAVSPSAAADAAPASASGDLDFDLDLDTPPTAGAAPAIVQASGLDLDLDFFQTDAVSGANGVTDAQGSDATAPMPLENGEREGDVVVAGYDSTAPAALEDGHAAASLLRVLLIDPDRDARLYLRAKLAAARLYDVDEAATGADALALLTHGAYKLVLLDLEQADMGIWKLLRHLRQSGRVSQTILTGARFSPLDRLRAWFGDVSMTMVKPLHPARLMRELEKVRRRGP
ncbi:MAG: response regulator [Polaromonas sp.]|nr:response regulator [Polaromonas sp.]